MTFIFETRVKPGYLESDYVEAWQRASNIIQKQSGALGSWLHRKIGESNVLLAIAIWESREARISAMTNLKNSDEDTRKIIDEHWEIGEITVLGDFDEPAWTVEHLK